MSLINKIGLAVVILVDVCLIAAMITAVQILSEPIQIDTSALPFVGR